MARSKFVSIAVALICAAGVAVAAQSGTTKDKKKDDGAVTTAAKTTAKTTADGAKATGKKSAEVAKATGRPFYNTSNYSFANLLADVDGLVDAPSPAVSIRSRTRRTRLACNLVASQAR